MFSLIFSRRFAMGHRLIAGDSAKCAVPHGHNEEVTVVLRASRPSPLDGAANMIEPFERAKATWHRWIDDHLDHALQLSDSDPLLAWFASQEPHHLGRVLVTPGDPTTELLACCMMAKLNAFLDADGGRLTCADIRLQETATNTVAFEGNPALFLPATGRELCWWQRPDMSINDLESTGSTDTMRLLAATAR
jgi:6-pyruvoyltetrahydropterin/6-carboxytetrahydropterin synthase